MPGRPAFLLFPRFESYTQVNTMVWDLRGKDAAQDRRCSPNPRFPMPSKKALCVSEDTTLLENSS
ncbi:hypothetical protein BDR03DRAFT_974099 [Suillus americanus]|nr:hypothetical protein BDR03DRAFT_974099 [Suillus americanus]